MCGFRVRSMCFLPFPMVHANFTITPLVLEGTVGMS